LRGLCARQRFTFASSPNTLSMVGLSDDNPLVRTSFDYGGDIARHCPTCIVSLHMARADR
jgi:hypothetical protein